MTTWSKTPPTEPGYYWCKHRGTLLALSLGGKALHSGGRRDIEYGPAIPSPEAVEAAKDALRDMDCSCDVGLATDAACTDVLHAESCNYRVARAALAKLEGR